MDADRAPLDDIRVSQTAQNKSSRYLTPEQLRTVLRTASGYVCRKTSPNHDGLYDDSKFIMRGTFYETQLDIVFTVENDYVTVVTQMSQHADSLRGRFYDHIGETAGDAIEMVSN